jgi:hypothetical protein
LISLGIFASHKVKRIEKNTLPIQDTNRDFLLAAPFLPIDGMNEKGLAAGMLLVRQPATCQNTGKKGITTTTAIRMILDKCACVEEAVEMIQQYDMHASGNVDYHFHIADANGNRVILEYVDHKLSIVDSPCATNFMLTEGVSVGFGQDRYDTLKQGLYANPDGFTDSLHAMSLLQAVAGDTTQWSSLYNLTAKTLLLAVQRDYKQPYSFSL